jgi:NADH-quinone oxidoreductase subunit F
MSTDARTPEILPTAHVAWMLPAAPVSAADRAESLRRTLALYPAEILARVETAGLRGRSGQGRPVADKWRLCAVQPDGPRYVVLNATDADPLMPAASVLLRADPIGVLEGLRIAARAVGATTGFVFVDRDDTDLQVFLTRCIQEMGGELPLAIAPGEARFVCREDTALLASMAGRPTMSSLTPPMPAERGFDGRPTVVHHAETYAQLAALFRREPAPSDPGTKLFRVDGPVVRPGMFELPLGLPLRTVVDELCGGMLPGKTLQFVQVGGPNGPVLTPDELDIALDYAAFEACGLRLGSGSVAVFAQDACIVDFAKNRLTFLEEASCGRCVMCREGSWQVREILGDMTVGKSRQDDRETLEELCAGMREGSLCSVGQTAPDVVVTAMARFGDAFEQHLKRKKCATLVCNRYATFHILSDKCTGCTDCLRECPVQAISGEDGYIHVIDQDLCNQCGICENICKPGANAVARAGTVKPQTPPEPVPVGTFKAKPVGLGGLGGLRRPTA